MKKDLDNYYKMLCDLDIDDTDLCSMRDNIINKYGEHKVCNKCGHKVIKSDLKGYSYLCLDCDENLFNFEVKEVLS